MAELQRKDIISDDALEAPLVLAKNLEVAYEVVMKIAKASKDMPKEIPLPKLKDQKEETEELTLAQAELLKVQKQIALVTARNNEEYIKESKALAAVKKELKDNIALGELEAKELNAKNASLKQLEAALAKNKEAYRNLAGEEARASAAGKELLKVIQQQDKAVKDINESTGDFTDNVGNYGKAGEAFGAIAPATSAAAFGIKNMVKASLAFIATPIGLVVTALAAAIFALKSYFAGSEEGQNRLNKIVLVAQTIFEKFMDVVEDMGEAIYNAFTNPKEALIAFGNFLKNQIINRFMGWLELIPALGKAIGLLFEGKFKEAGKVALDAVGKVVLGVENATDAIVDFIDDVGDAVDEGIKQGNRLADIQAQLDKDERALIEQRAKTALEVAKLRAKALEVEGGERKQILLEAIALEEQLAAKETALARLRLEQAELTAKANGADKEALKAISEARAAVYAAEATAFQNTLRFKKEIEALDEAERKATEARLAAKLKASEEYFQELVTMSKQSIKDQADVQLAAIEKEKAIIQQAVVDGFKTREQGDKELAELGKKSALERIELEIKTLQQINEIYGVSAEEKAKIEEKLAELRTKLLQEQYNQVKEAGPARNKIFSADQQKWAEEQQKGIMQWKDETFNTLDEIGGISAQFTERKLGELEAESEAEQAKTDALLEQEDLVTAKRLENEDLTEAQRKQIEETSAARKEAIEESNLKKQEAIEAKKKKAIRKQAIFEKAIAITKGTINLAQSILTMMTAGPGVGFVFAALAAALGAVQLGIIATTPIPAAAEGITGHKGGLIVAGEKGQELVRMPGGKYALTDSVAKVYDFPRGTDIIPHEETMRMLAADSLRLSGAHGHEAGEGYGRLEKKLDRINSTIKNKREWNLVGRVTGYNDGGTRAKYIERLRNRPN